MPKDKRKGGRATPKGTRPAHLRPVEDLPRDASPLDDVIDNRDYEWLAPYMQDPEHRRRSFGWDLDLLVRILGWAGIAVRVDATTEPDRYDQTRQRLVGGTLQLTPVGRWWLAERP